MPSPFKVTVLISGGGTTLKNLIALDSIGGIDFEIADVVSNNANAGGLAFASDAGISSTVISHRDFKDIASFSQAIFDRCRETNSKLVVMGGFLRRLKIPSDFENRVVNIHPSLIPSFCGKGHYGSRVHQGVVDYGCKISGCTVHFVDDQYDHGPIIAQETVPVLDDDSALDLAKRVFEKECELYPSAINAIAKGRVSVSDRKVVIRNLS
ncbi:MAG: phosphoribosylglycinamide formyltransferase-1 [Mariniblastus sp.]|jgi:phosphoribosylglycinamide formyltransferase-1